MSADMQYCPKCGSLNAHFSYPEQPAESVTAPQATSAAAPVPSSQQEVPAGHVSTIAAPPAQDDRPEDEGPGPDHEVYRVPVPPQMVETPAPPAQHDRPEDEEAVPHHEVYRVPAQHDRPEDEGPGPDHQVFQVLAEPQMVETPAPPAWPGPSVDDPDVELSPTWREGMVRVPRRPIAYARGVSFSRNPKTAATLEFLGFVGFMGVGHWYGGHFVRGWFLMIAWWVVLANLVLPFLPNLSPLTLVTTIIIVSAGPTASAAWIASELQRKSHDRFGE
jgi:hypothetical protein